jgi:hypothetical protein
MKRRFFPKAFDKRENCVYSEVILLEIRGVCKKAQYSEPNPNGGTCWELGEFRILGFF